MPILLASASTRRAALLEEAGIASTTIPPDCDDGVFTCGVMRVNDWVQSLAVLKVQSLMRCCDTHVGTILGADTVCVVDDSILGQPKTVEEAETMLRVMVNRSHEVYTGWCLASVDGLSMKCDYEQSTIEIGPISDEEIEKYLHSERWKGKAGGYNLSERVNAGWPISCIGDPTTVMGLPMNQLKQELSRSGN